MENDHDAHPFCLRTGGGNLDRLGWRGQGSGGNTPNGRSWLDTMVIPPSTPNTPITPSAASTLPRSDWARDYYAAQGITWSSGPSFTVQQNGPTTTYTWTRPSYSSIPGPNGGAVLQYRQPNFLESLLCCQPPQYVWRWRCSTAHAEQLRPVPVQRRPHASPPVSNIPVRQVQDHNLDSCGFFILNHFRQCTGSPCGARRASRVRNRPTPAARCRSPWTTGTPRARGSDARDGRRGRLPE